MIETRFVDMKHKWIRKPKQVSASDNRIKAITESGTDLWQRTYYGGHSQAARYLTLHWGNGRSSYTLPTYGTAVFEV